MTKAEAINADLGRELFRCKPKSIREYSKLRFQGIFPFSAYLRWIDKIAPAILPITENLLLAGLPTILVIFVLQVVLDLKPPHEPIWVRPLCFTILGLSIPFSIWWYWFTPQCDFLIVYERGIIWRVSLNRLTYLRSRGSLIFDDIKDFSYRADWLRAEPLETGNSTNEKLDRLLIELGLSRHDIAFHFKNERNVTVEKLFARFDKEDLQRFINHLETCLKPNQIAV